MKNSVDRVWRDDLRGTHTVVIAYSAEVICDSRPTALVGAPKYRKLRYGDWFIVGASVALSAPPTRLGRQDQIT